MKIRSVVVVCLASLTLLGTYRISAADEPVDYKRLFEEQKSRNDDLEKRLSILEGKSTQDVYVVKEEVPEETLKFLKNTSLSGYVASSYFYDFNLPRDHMIAGRGFDFRHDDFMANKAVITLQKEVEYNAFDWQAGYAVQLIFGQDAEFTQASGLDLGSDGDLFLANVVVNVPIGNGLKVTLGKYGTVLGYEASLTEMNANWSAGYQWTFVEPFTHTGIILGYKPIDDIEVQILLNNGWDNVTDNNGGKSVIGMVTYTPCDNTSFTLSGFGGPEQDVNNSNWRKGVEAIISQKLTPKLTGIVQLDYGAEDGADANGRKAEWTAVGAWLTYDINDHYSAAVRGDWLKDGDGARTSGTPFRNPFPVNNGQQISSVTLTLNYKPIPEVRISPEFRWDHSTLDTAFDGHPDQLTLGFGAAYFY